MATKPTWTLANRFTPTLSTHSSGYMAGYGYEPATKLCIVDSSPNPGEGVWISEDKGASWQAGAAPWSARYGVAVASFGYSEVGLGLFGGQGGGAGGTPYYDEYWWWNAGTDPGEWSGPARPGPHDHAWPPGRCYHAFLNPGDAGQWLLGGLAHDDELVLNDVWEAGNGGLTWTQLTPNAAWSPRSKAAVCGTARGLDHKTGVGLSQLWLFGGQDAHSNPVEDQAWMTIDGAHWTPVAAPWAGESRSDAAAVALPSSDGSFALYVLGGRDDQMVGKTDLWMADLTWTAEPGQDNGWYVIEGWSLVDDAIPCGLATYMTARIGGSLYVIGDNDHLYVMTPA